MDNQSEVEEEVDNCVLCNVPTTYLITDDIYTRLYYIEGMGQLCSRCYYDHQQYSRESDVGQIMFDLE